MVDYYKLQCELSEKDEAGSSRRDRLLQVYKTTGEKPPLLQQEFELDFRVQPYYLHFIELCKYRRVQASMMGAVYETLTPTLVTDWMRLEHQDIGVFGWEVIKALDNAFQTMQIEKQSKKKTESKDKPKLRGRI